MTAGSWEVPAWHGTTRGELSALPDGRAIFNSLREWVTLPPATAITSRSAQLQARELLDWGFSTRGLSDLIGTTHPTLGNVLEGKVSALSKSPNALAALERVHELASRLASFESKDPGVIERVLLSKLPKGERLADLAVNGRPGDAYLEALKRISPRPTRTLQRPSMTRGAGDATVSLDDN